VSAPWSMALVDGSRRLGRRAARNRAAAGRGPRLPALARHHPRPGPGGPAGHDPGTDPGPALLVVAWAVGGGVFAGICGGGEREDVGDHDVCAGARRLRANPLAGPPGRASRPPAAAPGRARRADRRRGREWLEEQRLTLAGKAFCVSAPAPVDSGARGLPAARNRGGSAVCVTITGPGIIPGLAPDRHRRHPPLPGPGPRCWSLVVASAVGLVGPRAGGRSEKGRRGAV
jgi:hypothetical protein